MPSSPDRQDAESLARFAGERAPLSFAQQSIRFLHEVHPGSPARNVARAYRLAGPLDVDRLRRALTEVVARHEILHYAFGAAGDGQPFQVASQLETTALPVGRFPYMCDITRDYLQASFDANGGERLRAWLFRVNEDDHVLLLCADPMAVDDEALDILAGELGALYSAPAQDAIALFGDSPARYSDLVAKEQDGSPRQAVAYWERQLAGLQRLELPTDRPRTGAGAFASFRERSTISAEVTDALKRIASEHDTTLGVVAAAAFAALLARLSGQYDVAMGTTANRARPELKQLVGRFANLVVLRIDVLGDPDFLELLSRTRDAVTEARQNQDAALGRLARLADEEHSPSRAPLVDVLISCTDAPELPLALTDVTVTEYPLDPGVAWFDLEVHLTAGAGGLVITADSRADLFERATIKRMLGQFGQLLASVSDEPTLRVSALPLLSAEETAELMRWGQVTKPVKPAGRCLRDLFADQVATRPHASAVRSGERVLTYRDLDERSDQVARVLRDCGVGPDVCVGVSVKRSIESVVALLGVIKADGCYLPLDPTYPSERLSFMLADSGAAVLITTPGDQERIPGWVAATVLITEDGATSAPAGSSPRPRSAANPKNLAYVMYTSGSTGIPKGVAIAHEGIVRLVRDTNYITFGPSDRVAHVSNLSFDASTFEIWGALLNGGELVIIPAEEALAPQMLAARLRDCQISVLIVTPALFTFTLREVPDAFQSLTTLLVGGGPLDPSAARDVLRSSAPGRLVNAYGPTENTVMVAAHLVTPLPDDAACVPIGRPVTGSYVYVLDENLRLVSAGVPGELCVGGLGLARGYLGKPGLTAERFVSDPYGPDGGRIYRTGDTARWLPGGVLEFLGRRDEQVKLRGYRIEPGEIQARLAACNGVGSAVVTVRADNDGEQRIVGYVVPASEDQQPGTSQLRAELARWLPGYMLPSALVVVPEIPLTPAGKVDHSRLPSPGQEAESDAATAPRGGVEETVAQVWSLILRVPCPGPDDDFFDLGGDSLQATRAIARLRKELGATVQVRDLFDNPTVAGLAAVIAAGLDDG